MNETAPFMFLKLMITYHTETGRVAPYNPALALLLHGGSCLAQKTEPSCCLCTYTNVFTTIGFLLLRNIQLTERNYISWNYYDTNCVQARFVIFFGFRFISINTVLSVLCVSEFKVLSCTLYFLESTS